MSEGPVLLDGGGGTAACGCQMVTGRFGAIVTPCAQHHGQMTFAMFPASKREAVERALRGGEEGLVVPLTGTPEGYGRGWEGEERKDMTTDRLMLALELAWGVIANAGGGDWRKESPEWQEAATRWRDEHWHPALDAQKAATTDRATLREHIAREIHEEACSIPWDEITERHRSTHRERAERILALLEMHARTTRDG